MLLLIACGNTLRQDDGAGHALAQRLHRICQQRDYPSELIQVQQLTPELAWNLAQPEVTMVVFVDTRQVAPDETTPAVQVTHLTPDEASVALGHHLTPPVLLLYAEQLYKARPSAWLITVPGIEFGYGETFSPLTSQALAEAQFQH